ncbi:hypothetical protein J6590_046968 [Homalodisca vitripennis]|nr:hypothetical protein J6590_046968 [Homalodisca vitripennis]
MLDCHGSDVDGEMLQTEDFLAITIVLLTNRLNPTVVWVCVFGFGWGVCVVWVWVGGCLVCWVGGVVFGFVPQHKGVPPLPALTGECPNSSSWILIDGGPYPQPYPSKISCHSGSSAKAFIGLGAICKLLSLVVVSVYCPSDGDLNDFFDQLEGCLGYLIRPRPNLRLIFCGDFNVHLECSSKEEESFTNFFRSFGLFVTNRLPTRGSACLDTIVMDLDSWNYTVGVVNPMVADHEAVAMKIENCLVSTPPSPSWHVKYSFSKRVVKDELLPLFRRELESVDWDKVIGGNTPVAAFDFL